MLPSAYSNVVPRPCATVYASAREQHTASVGIYSSVRSDICVAC